MNTEFKIAGIHCNGCLALIKMSIEELKGIKEIKVNKTKNKVIVSYNEKQTSVEEIIKKIEQSGYKVERHKCYKN